MDSFMTPHEQAPCHPSCKRWVSAQDPQDQVLGTKEGQRAGIRDKGRRQRAREEKGTGIVCRGICPAMGQRAASGEMWHIGKWPFIKVKGEPHVRMRGLVLTGHVT